MANNNSGKIVKTKDGLRGRTFNSQDYINGKVIVYLEIFKNVYSDKAILCRPETLEVIGFID